MEVFGTGAGGDVDDAGTLFVADIFPLDDAVKVACFGLSLEFVERAAITPTQEMRAFDAFNNFVLAV